VRVLYPVDQLQEATPGLQFEMVKALPHFLIVVEEACAQLLQ
jgi:hypothetical protein